MQNFERQPGRSIFHIDPGQDLKEGINKADDCRSPYQTADFICLVPIERRGSLMTERRIRLRNVHDAQTLVRAAGKCDYPVDLRSERFVVDAKSLLDVLCMDLTRSLTVQYDHETDPVFDRELAKFCV